MEQLSKTERAKVGREFVSETPKMEFLRWTGRSRKVIDRLANLFGFPFPAEGPVNTADFIRWVIVFLNENERKLFPKGRQEQTQLFDDEERLLKAKADNEEIKRDEKLRSLLRRDEVHDVLSQWSGILKSAGESLGKKYGPDAQELLVDALSDCESLVEEL